MAININIITDNIVYIKWAIIIFVIGIAAVKIFKVFVKMEIEYEE